MDQNGTAANQLNERFNKTINIVCDAIRVACKWMSNLKLTFSIRKLLQTEWTRVSD